MRIRFVVAAVLVAALVNATHVIEAQPVPQPAPPEQICGACIIYGVPDPATPPLAPPGVYQIDVCAGTAIPVKWLAAAYNLAVRNQNTLWAGTNPGAGLFSIDLLSAAAPAAFGSTSANPTGMGEGGNGSLYDVDLMGDLHELIPQPPRLVGNAGTSTAYPGDIVVDRSSCRLLAGLSIRTSLSWVRVHRSTGSVTVLNQTPGVSHIGLAFDGAGRLWSAQGHTVVQVDPNTGMTMGVPVNLAHAGIPIAMVDLANEPCGECVPEGQPDLGDAPDSTNHTALTMSAYPSVLASYPTVFDSQTGWPSGPKHWFASEDAWLGSGVSAEQEADLPPDQDVVTNIDPSTDTPDRDGFDDGLLFPVTLPHCQVTSVNYLVTVAGAQRLRRTNVWFDFNRDGDWADTLACIDTQGIPQTVSEWVVRNQTTNLAPGTHTVPSPSFLSYDPGYPQGPLWSRITLSDGGAVGSDGRGPIGGFEFGETEDYRLLPTGSGAHYSP